MTWLFYPRHFSRTALALLEGAAVLGLVTTVAMAQGAPPPPPEAPMHVQPAPHPRPPQPPPHDDRPQKALSGTISSYNRGPRGDIESIMLKAGDEVVQVNLPPDAAARLGTMPQVGEHVKLQAKSARDIPDHAVYDLAAIAGADGKMTEIGGPGSDKIVHIQGTITQLNYSRHGDVDGVILDNGDFVHVGPDPAVKGHLKVGDKLTVDGRAHPMAMGHQVIEADKIDGRTVHRPPHPPRPPHPRRGPHDGPPPPPPGNAP